MNVCRKIYDFGFSKAAIYAKGFSSSENFEILLFIETKNANLENKLNKNVNQIISYRFFDGCRQRGQVKRDSKGV